MIQRVPLKPCPACDGVPSGQAWLCKLCRGSQAVSEKDAVDYCQGLVDEARENLARAEKRLHKALWS